MRVYIQQKDSEPKELLPGAIITLEGMSVAASGNTASVSATIEDIISGTTASQFVTKINEVVSSDDGGFLIEGSECVSWSYTPATIIDPSLRYQENEYGIKIPVPIKGAVLITDMCPSCTTCESIYRLKYELENMKMWINTLKDVNLYTEDQALSRKQGLSALRVTGATSACGIYPVDDFTMKATQLYKEYVTMLHMWNYAVSINNSSAVIQLAPESTAGFVVQTKHAVTSCENKIKLQCAIEVTKSSQYIKGSSEVAVPVEYWRMSVYVPPESMKFTHGPFVTSNDPAANPGFGPVPVIPATVPPTTFDPVCITGTQYTTKTIKSAADPVDVQEAGTYMLEAKFLPFIPSVSTINGTTVTANNWQNINTNVDPTVTPDVSGGTTYTYAYDIVTTLQNPIQDPTRENYLNSCIAPASAVDLSIVWNVVITWKIWEEGATDPKIEQESYVYKCNAVSTPCSNVVSPGGSTIHVPDVTPPEPETTQNGTNVSE